MLTRSKSLLWQAVSFAIWKAIGSEPGDRINAATKYLNRRLKHYPPNKRERIINTAPRLAAWILDEEKASGKES